MAQLSKAMSSPVVLPSDMDPIPVTVQYGGSLAVANDGTQTNVSASSGAQTILARNNSRRGAYVVNDSTAICYMLLGSAQAVTTSVYTVALQAGQAYEMPPGLYNGPIKAIWSSSTGSARITEIV